MKQPLEVVFCGDSLYLAGLAASFQPNQGLRIIIIESPLENAWNDLKMIHPEMVIFENQPNSMRYAETLWASHPGLCLVAIDPVAEMITVYSITGRMFCPLTDLARVVLKFKTAN